MEKLTLSGIGSFLVGFAGNILVEVFPMTGWEISQELARVIVFICSGLMLLGVILIVMSFIKTKKTYNEHLQITNEMLKVYKVQGGQLQGLDTVAISAIRQELDTKKQIPHKLEEIDNYFVGVMNSQDLTIEILKQMGKNNKVLGWYDLIFFFFVAPFYSQNIFRRIFKNALVNYVVRFTTKLNLALCEYGLGTIPTVQGDLKYLKLYQELIQLESNLPYSITAKIHRNILLSISLNSLRILRSNSSFWNVINSQKVKYINMHTLTLIRNSLSMLMIILDSSIVGLRGEISSDIEKHIDEVIQKIDYTSKEGQK